MFTEYLYIDAIWLSVAFLFGLLARHLNLPALIGFLITGIVLNILGITGGNISNVLNTLSELGVMLLLFTIGLKIKIKSLIKPEVWITASVHILLTVLAIAGFIFLISFCGIRHFSNLSVQSSLLIGFALSFSSTVFVVKILEERGELSSFHGKIAIGILVIQDIIAVLFLSLTNSETPSLWALLLPLYLYLVRFILNPILKFSGHGELLTVFGFFATFVVGALSFKLVGLKPDLGALTAGMILVGHKKADELYDRMMNYKDFFLIAFFISIGLKGVPDISIMTAALLLSGFILLKGGLFVMIFSFFNIKARTSFLTSMSLSNFSEFGLITAFVGQKMGLITDEWLLIIAILMSISFFISSPLNTYAHTIFDKYKRVIQLLNRGKNCVDNEVTHLGDAEYLIIGMGSLGQPAYLYFAKMYPGKVVGIDYSHDKVAALQKDKLHALWGDATNSVFWSHVDLSKIKIIMLAMSDYNSNLNSLIEIVKIKNRHFKIGAICHYDDEAERFKELNADYIYDYKTSVGADFAEQTLFAVRSNL